VSPQTIRAYLKSLGYRWKNSKRKPKLSDKDKRVKFEWAQSHKNYDLSNVAFSDESSFWLIVSHTRCGSRMTKSI